MKTRLLSEAVHRLRAVRSNVIHLKPFTIVSAALSLALFLAFTGYAASGSVHANGRGHRIDSTLPEDDWVWPGESWDEADPDDMDMDESKLEDARDYAEEKGGGSGMVIRNGKVVITWGSQSELYILHSTTKSIGVTALGLAIEDGLVELDDKAREHLPSIGVPPRSNKDSDEIEDITILNLATHTAGFDKTGGFGKILYEPGTRWYYSDGGANWLADVLTAVFGEDLNDVMFDRVFEPLGIESSDLKWRENFYRPRELNDIERREFGSGIRASVDAMARIGYLYLRGGQWEDEQIIPDDFVEKVRRPVEEVEGLPLYDSDLWPGAPEHYGLLWWNNADCRLSEVPRDMFTSWGLGESFITVIPSLDLVVVRAGDDWREDRDDSFYDVLEPFLNRIMESIVDDPSCE